VIARGDAAGPIINPQIAQIFTDYLFLFFVVASPQGEAIQPTALTAGAGLLRFARNDEFK